MTQIPDAAVQAFMAEFHQRTGVSYEANIRASLEKTLPHLPLGYEVKKLEWLESKTKDGRKQWQANGEAITETHSEWDTIQGFRLFNLMETHPTLEEAKAAAQADFECRVRECIIAKPVEVLDDAIMQAKVSEIGNRIHNLGCEHQNDVALSDRFREIRDQLWDISKHYTKPVDVAAVRRLALEEAATLIDEGFDKAVGKSWRNDGKPSKNDRCPHDKFMYEDCENCASAAIRAISAEPAQGEP